MDLALCSSLNVVCDERTTTTATTTTATTTTATTTTAENKLIHNICFN